MNEKLKRLNVTYVTNWRIRAKEKLVNIAGCGCNICGYDTTVRALEFHHIDEKEKSFSISDLGHTRSFERCVNEIKKCILLCANCHREVHAGIIDVNYEDREFNYELAEQYCEEIKIKKEPPKYDDCVCGNKKLEKQQYCSRKCSSNARLPTKLLISGEKLTLLYEEFNNYEKLGRMFNVSGAAIKRKLRKFEKSITIDVGTHN